MNIDLGSPILDVAIGIAFVFFLLSLIVSAVTEFAAGVFNLRARTLKDGVEGMLGDAVLADKVMRHPLVRTQLVTKKGTPQTVHKERGPSYISAQAFARTFFATVDTTDRLAADLEEQLGALGVDPHQVVKSNLKTVEKWFNDSMARVSGWYKRKSQIIAVVVAVIVAFGLNANAIRIFERLDQEPSTRAAVVKAAERTREHPPTGGTKANAVVEIEYAGKHFSEATKEIDALNLPLFWTKANSLHSIPWWKTVLGLLVTTIAISLGAPFWFDALGKLANLRMAGKKPKEGAEAPA